MATRGHGEGSIYQRTSGTWAATIALGSDANGKRVRKTVYGPTKKSVTDKLTRLQNQRLDGTFVDSGKMTVGELLDRWLADSAKPNTEPNTYIGYEQCVRLHIKPAIGAIRLSKLMPIDVQRMFSTLKEKATKKERTVDGKKVVIETKLGDRSLCYIFSTLRRALNVGLRWGLVVRNVCDACDPPKSAKSHVTALVTSEVTELLKATHGTRWHALFVLAITTGLRQGELFGLTWENVDLDRGVLSVRHSLEEIAGKHRLKEPKSNSGRRQVTLPGPAIESLWTHKAILMREGLGAAEMVFPDTEGGWLRKSNFDRKVWQKFRAVSKIPEATTFHDLRHTSATILLAAGVHPKVVQERLGHASIKLTMDTYSHILPSMQADAATKFDHIRPRIADVG